MNLQLVKAIVVLPGTALVYVPGAILWFAAFGSMSESRSPGRP